MTRAATKKNDYLISLNKQLEAFNEECNSIKAKFVSKDFPNESEIQKKYRRLEESMKRFSWKIDHLKESDIDIDDLVRESFNDIIDETTLQIEDVELALDGKHFWDVDDKFRRDKWKIEEFQDY